MVLSMFGQDIAMSMIAHTGADEVVVHSFFDVVSEFGTGDGERSDDLVFFEVSREL